MHQYINIKKRQSVWLQTQTIFEDDGDIYESMCIFLKCKDTVVFEVKVQISFEGIILRHHFS